MRADDGGQHLEVEPEEGSSSAGRIDPALDAPVIFPTDVAAALIHQPVKLVVHTPAPAQRTVVPSKFVAHCIWSKVREKGAKRCENCLIRENGGADQVVDLALPLEELVAAVGSQQNFLHEQARRLVRCHRDCSHLKVTESRDIYFQTGFEPLDPERPKTEGFAVEVVSDTGLPVGERLHVTGRVVEVGRGLRLIHDGPIELAPEPPHEASRRHARAEMQAFVDFHDPVEAFARAVQLHLTGNLRTGVTDMTAALLLTVISPAGLPLPDGRQTFSRRAQTLLLGDYAVFKSSTMNALMNVIGFGTVVGSRMSLAGLIGTIETLNGIPRPRWGAMVREHRGILNIEEAGTLNPQVVAAIRDARERGSTSLHLRGMSFSAPSAPAIVVSANPSMNATLSSFGMWAEALSALESHALPDLRRFTIVVPISLDALSSPPIDTDNLPKISASTLKSLAWVARTITGDRVDVDTEAVTLATAAENELQRLMPRHAAIQALLVHSTSKILHLAAAWSIARQVPLQGDRVNVTAADVNSVVPLYKRVLLAWTTKGLSETFDPAAVQEIVLLLREATRSLGRKHRLDPLAGLRRLQAEPFGLTMAEWAAHLGVSDKTVRDTWLRPLFEPQGLVERISTRYRITPLGRAVIAATEGDPPEGGGDCRNESGTLHGHHTEEAGTADATKAHGDDRPSGIPFVRSATTVHPLGEDPSVRKTEIPEVPEIAPALHRAKQLLIIPPTIEVSDFLPRPDDGTLRPLKVISDDRKRNHALGKTGGFLGDYTHTLNPAVGCVFSCTWCGQYCYAQHETPARLIAAKLGLRWGEYLFIKERIAEGLKRDLVRASGRHPDHAHHVSKLKIFMSSLTEPCAGPALKVTRQCLDEFAAYPIGRLVLQTRSPRVVELLPQLKALGNRVLVSFTVESDSDEIWREVVPPMLPRIRDRRKAVATLHANGVTTSITVSPCARLADPQEFAVWIASSSTYAVVDTFVAGDGKGGTRTEQTEIPTLFASRAWMWNDETSARSLYKTLRGFMGDRVGWSKDGFNRLTSVPTGIR